MLNAEEAKTAGLLPAATNHAGNIITLPTNEAVVVSAAGPEDFTLSVDDDTAVHKVTKVGAGSIILAVAPAIPQGTSISVSYEPSKGSITGQRGQLVGSVPRPTGRQRRQRCADRRRRA